MAIGPNLTSDISSYIQTVYDDAMFVLRENNLAAQLVKVFTDLSSTATRTGKDYSEASIVTSIGEDDDLVAQKWNPSDGQSLTPGEIGAQFFLTDLRLASDPENLRNDAAMELGMAGATQIDQDVFGNFNALTGGTIGASGSANSWGYFYAMATKMRINKVPKPWYYVCTAAQYHPLGTALAQGGGALQVTGSLAESVVGDFYLGRQAGIEIFVSENLETSSNDAYAAMFNPLAIALDVRRAPRLEPERDASRRGIELNFTSVYAHGIWKPTWGVQAIFSNTAPTS